MELPKHDTSPWVSHVEAHFLPVSRAAMWVVSTLPGDRISIADSGTAALIMTAWMPAARSRIPA